MSADAPAPTTNDDNDADVDVRDTNPLAGAVTITPDSFAPSKLHRAIFSADRMRTLPVAAARALATAAGDIPSYRRRLDDAGVTALDGRYQQLALGVARGEQDAQFNLARITRQLGGQTSADLRSTIDAIFDGSIALLHAAVDADPEFNLPRIAVRFDNYADARAGQRQKSLAILVALAELTEVIFVADDDDTRRILWRDGEVLPDSVRDACNPRPPREEHDGDEPITPDQFPDRDYARSEEAVLLSIADAPSEETTYTRLTGGDRVHVSQERVRGIVAEFVNDNLVYTEPAPDSSRRKRIGLTPLGMAVVRHRLRENGVESRLDDYSDTPRNPRVNIRVSQGKHGRGDRDGQGGRMGQSPRSKDGGWVSVEFFGAWEHQAAASLAPESGVGVADYPIEKLSDGRTPLFSYDASRDEVVVGAEFNSPVQYVTCLARAFACGQMWEQVLTEERLDAGGNLAGLYNGNRIVLTRCSQAGWCSQRENTADRFVSRLRGELSRICSMTRDYRDARADEDHERAGKLASAILREGHGLIGTITWLLHCCDVDVTRVVRLPNYSRNLHTTPENNYRRSLLKTLSKMTTISSRYGAYTAERTLFEARPKKRKFQLGAPQTTADSSGTLIGNWAIVGDGATKLIAPGDGPGLRSAFSSPGELQEGATNYAAFEVSTPIRIGDDEAALRASVDRLCAWKNLEATEVARRTFAALCESPFDVLAAGRGLKSEASKRPIANDEVRRGLASLPSTRLLPSTGKPSIGKVLGVLLNADEGLTQSDLADRAGVSSRTVTNNAGILQALALVDREDRGPGLGYVWRASLPSREERGDETRDGSPWRLDSSADEAGREQPAAVSIHHMLADLAYVDTGKFPDSYDGIIRDLPAATEESDLVREWLPVAARLAGVTLDLDAFDSGQLIQPLPDEASFGDRPTQTSLSRSSGGVA